jgi:DNA-binding CsgD family transcriptional regulator
MNERLSDPRPTRLYRLDADLRRTVEYGNIPQRQRLEPDTDSRTAVRAGDNPLIRAAERLSAIDPQLARNMYLEALGGAIRGRAGHPSPEIRALAEAASKAPPASWPCRPVDLLLNGLITRYTAGYGPAVPRLRLALRAVDDVGKTAEYRRWLWLVARIASDIWDDQTWRELTQGHETALPPGGSGARGSLVAQYTKAVTLNGSGQYEDALLAAREVCEHNDLGLQGLALSELVEAAVRSSRPGLARSAIARLAERALACGGDWALGTLARARAQVSRSEQAEALYRESVERTSRARIGPELARSHLLYGEWLRRENRRVDAREQLDRARSTFGALGALTFVERAHRELLATGETARERTVSSYRELTPQEERIAQLAGTRFTNSEIATQLFISPRTVEWHLRKVFTKLGVTSRRELLASLARRRNEVDELFGHGQPL